MSLSLEESKIFCSGKGKKAFSLMVLKISQLCSKRVNSFPNNKFWTLPNSKSLQTTISKLIEMAESSPDG